MNRFLMFLIIIFTVGFTQTLFAQCKDKNCGLVVRGKVTSLQIDRSSKDGIIFEVQLAMEFKNENDQPIILFKPNTDNSYFGNRYYLDGKSLALSKNEKPFFSRYGGESIAGSPFYRDLANKLDTKTPLEEYTKILQPNEVWSFTDKTTLYFSKKKEKYQPPNEISWEEMQELPSQLWLAVNYELNPWNVEFFKPKLLRKLKKRWASYGNVLIDRDDNSRFGSFGISSEPMLIDFSQVKEKISENK